MESLIERDLFTDHELLKEPYAYFEALRELGPVVRPPGKDYLVVTGFEEALEVLRNSDDYSAAIALQGAAEPLPFAIEGADITDQIETHRILFEGGRFVVNLDDDAHANLRALVNTFFTPSRLKANEEFIRDYSDKMIREVVANGGCDLIRDIATPYVTIVVADLLGVPADDRQSFMDMIAAAPPPGNLDGGNSVNDETHWFVRMGAYFDRYLADRRANKLDDILSELANAIYPDGTMPELADLSLLGVFMFGAGQDTSAKLLGTAVKYIIEQPGLQEQLRANPTLIPQFIEEVLRLEGSTKQTARLARHDTRIGEREVPAGTKVLVALSAANRDPRRWEDPSTLRLDRPKIKEHVGFGRGRHVCAGAPLARVEVRIILEKLLEYTAKIELDEAWHGPSGKRELVYEPSFIVRGLEALHVKLMPSLAAFGCDVSPPLFPDQRIPARD